MEYCQLPCAVLGPPSACASVLVIRAPGRFIAHSLVATTSRTSHHHGGRSASLELSWPRTHLPCPGRDSSICSSTGLAWSGGLDSCSPRAPQGLPSGWLRTAHSRGHPDSRAEAFPPAFTAALVLCSARPGHWRGACGDCAALGAFRARCRRRAGPCVLPAAASGGVVEAANLLRVMQVQASRARLVTARRASAPRMRRSRSQSPSNSQPGCCRRQTRDQTVAQISAPGGGEPGPVAAQSPLPQPQPSGRLRPAQADGAARRLVSCPAGCCAGGAGSKGAAPRLLCCRRGTSLEDCRGRVGCCRTDGEGLSGTACG